VYWNRKHVLICTANHCMQKGANNVAGRLRIELKRRGLDVGLMVNTCDSIDLCDIGPNIVVYPEGVIYSHVQVSDLNDIIAHLTGGPIVERLVLSPASPEERNRQALFAEAVASDVLPADAFAALAARHDLDEAWVNEQARRGFIARKEQDGVQIVSITSKARARYGLAAIGTGD
jgi:(2Fe-2S) ferredoxin